MQIFSLSLVALIVANVLFATGCGAKGDPKPSQRFPPAACAVRSTGLRTLEIVLPSEDTQGNRLPGIEAVRVYYLPLGTSYPLPMEVFQQGEVILERRRPDLPSPGKALSLDLTHFGRPSGWLSVVPIRVGNIAGMPSQVLPWVDPAL